MFQTRDRDDGYTPEQVEYIRDCAVNAVKTVAQKYNDQNGYTELEGYISYFVQRLRPYSMLSLITSQSNNGKSVMSMLTNPQYLYFTLEISQSFYFLLGVGLEGRKKLVQYMASIITADIDTTDSIINRVHAKDFATGRDMEGFLNSNQFLIPLLVLNLSYGLEELWDLILEKLEGKVNNE